MIILLALHCCLHFCKKIEQLSAFSTCKLKDLTDLISELQQGCDTTQA